MASKGGHSAMSSREYVAIAADFVAQSNTVSPITRADLNVKYAMQVATRPTSLGHFLALMTCAKKHTKYTAVICF